MGQAHGPLRIPRQSTSFIGRDEEIQNIAARIESGKRLITVKGTGGIGKTRLAMEVGKRVNGLFPGGVYTVELAAVTDPNVIVPQIATLLNRQLRSNDTLVTVLQDTIDDPVLLILDNCEHVIDACATLVDDATTHERDHQYITPPARNECRHQAVLGDSSSGKSPIFLHIERSCHEYQVYLVRTAYCFPIPYPSNFL